jgi:hypothetical protein
MSANQENRCVMTVQSVNYANIISKEINMVMVGIDIGFGYTKATDGKRDIIFKSILGEATEILFQLLCRRSRGKAVKRKIVYT